MSWWGKLTHLFVADYKKVRCVVCHAPPILQLWFVRGKSENRFCSLSEVLFFSPPSSEYRLAIKICLVLSFFGCVNSVCQTSWFLIRGLVLSYSIGPKLDTMILPHEADAGMLFTTKGPCSITLPHSLDDRGVFPRHFSCRVYLPKNPTWTLRNNQERHQNINNFCRPVSLHNFSPIILIFIQEETSNYRY